MSKFSKRSIDNLIGVHPDLVRLMIESIKHSPVDFTVTEGVRTSKRQMDLYAQGRTSAGAIVTKKNGTTNKSNHQVKSDGYGYAVDLYPFYNGSVQVQDKEVINKLKLISVHIKAVAKRIGVEINWGGDWKNPFDPPHFELKK
jgi:peptidoglycan L-alanyl-D-glutamate endopeptidase CwlK